MVAKISNGEDVNIKGWRGKTSLHYAAEGGHKEVVGLLLARGAQVNAKDAWDYETPLHGAARGCHKDIVKLLVYYGADVNAKKRLDNTPLLVAALEGREQLEKLLNAKGADVTDDIVVYLRELERLKILIENDVNIDSRYLYDATATRG